MSNRTRFPKVFWVANSVEILERFAYYGIFMGFGMYMKSLGFDRDQLGNVQQWFLFISYFIPVFSGAFADKFGFKKVLIISYLAYIPSILFLTQFKTYQGIAFTMLSIGFAAGIFKPLISGTVRLSSDSTNKTLGFGIFYMMVNIGASVGPIVFGKMRGYSWDDAFKIAAAAIAVMFIITLALYKEPLKEKSNVSIGKKIAEIFTTVTDLRFAIFLLILGLFFWLPFWGFFNIIPSYVNDHIDTVKLFEGIRNLFGDWFARLLAREESGIWKINGEAIAHTGWIILVLQYFVSRIFEKRKAIPSFMFGLAILSLGAFCIGYSIKLAPAMVIFGIFIFAIGEMITSPRIQEYITWIAPKEKAGLYMGANFLGTCVGALLSGQYTKLFGKFENAGTPEYIWYIMAVHCLLAIVAIWLFFWFAGSFSEQAE
ncbi:MAG: MFS transporter [Bacteroidales bacterium]|nr:MFS transporter [Bacteroidales bacterium]